MEQPNRTVYPHPADIERQLAEALQAPVVTVDSDQEHCEVDDVSSQELLQMAWDKTEKELDDLNGTLRRLRQQFRDQEQSLLNRISQKKRLQQALLEHAPQAAASR